MRRVWFTSDIHVDHTNVLGLSKRQFKNINEMEKTIVSNINLCVKPEDVLYLLGDVSLGKKESWVRFLDALHCKNIILLRGNHDKWQAIPKDKVLTVMNSCVVTIFGQNLLLSHYPYRITLWRAIKAFAKIRSWKHVKELFSKARPKDTGLWLLHGHTHAPTILADYHDHMIHVGVDANKFMPISGEQIIALIQHQESKRKIELAGMKKLLDWAKQKLYSLKWK